MNQELEKLLNELDISEQFTTDSSISSKINSISSGDESFELESEKIAFLFHETNENLYSGWGTYYRPAFGPVIRDGQIYESPSLSVITEEMLSYWENRAEKTNNLIMKARYSGLVYDLTQKVLGRSRKPNYKTVVIYVESLIAICDKDVCERHIETIQKTKIIRAYKVACSIRNTPLIESCIDAAIRLEDRITEKSASTLLGFCFDLFVLGKEKLLREEQKEKLVSDLEARFVYVSTNNYSFQICESVGIPLAKYYRSQNRLEDVKRIITTVGRSFELFFQGQDELLQSFHYQHLHEIYIQFNLKDEAENISKKITEVGSGVIKNMQLFVQSMEISKESLDQYVVTMIEGGFDNALYRITHQFIPKIDEVQKIDPFTASSTIVSYDHRGIPIAKMTDPSDFDVSQLCKSMGENSLILHHLFVRLTEKYNPKAEDYLALFYRSPLFDKSKQSIVEKGILAFFIEDYITAIHLFVPQIEAAIRTLVKLKGGLLVVENNYDGFKFKTLDALLRDDIVKDYFGEDIAFYLRILLSDQRGWNIRNKVCHGMSPIEEFNDSIADRLMHVMLCLAIVKECNA
ncbi:hypothetical protein B9G53_18000 [Pseudanabaena sp. SR411]|uniref:DUF4209 domain-containing protein n=1 Tax=Pseudanabaena sp. SR411 TaxID=1980935 RepID=UPI000B996179|nr:DUF4209 domain-containing protein [Pseudanabaena sp. SR411]OYQ63253.1 hypothetical protein B9G53_18000 [Pseudanabaena sp. SR411]